MNKILSQALKKAVSEYSPNVNEVTKDKRPDLFSLNNETELFQNDKGIIIKIDRSRDANLTDFGKVQFLCLKKKDQVYFLLILLLLPGYIRRQLSLGPVIEFYS